jgi:hypothetical protein
VKRLHPLRQPTNAPSSFSFKDLSQFVVQSICQRIRSLHNNSQTVDIVSFIRCFDPKYTPVAHHTDADSIQVFLEYEYGADLITYLLTDASERHSKNRHQQRENHLADTFQAYQGFWSNIDKHWPTVPSLQTNLQCMQNYFHGSQWAYSSVCSVCSQKRNHSEFSTTTINPNFKDSKLTLDNLEVLRCRDRRLLTNFEFPTNENLNGLMLDRHGVHDNGSIEVCADVSLNSSSQNSQNLH